MDIEQRVLKLEFRVDDHEVDLKKLQDISESLKASLAGIEKTLMQIKWLAIGGGAAFLGNEMGLLKAFKLLLS